MISSIKGTVAHFEGMSAVVQCPGGVGFEVEVPASLLAELHVGSECFLYTVHIVREDAQLLYGFKDLSTRNLFREVIKVNGIGPKLGMALLSALPDGELLRALRSGQTAALTRVPGVGRKTAERLVMELRDRVERIMPGEDAGAVGKHAAEAGAQVAADEARQALVGLGYKESVAAALVSQVHKEGMDTRDIILAALAAVSSGRGS